MLRKNTFLLKKEQNLVMIWGAVGIVCFCKHTMYFCTFASRGKKEEKAHPPLEKFCSTQGPIIRQRGV